MGYRKAYYRKDGTYVSDSFDNRRKKPRKLNNKGCAGILIISISVLSALTFFS